MVNYDGHSIRHAPRCPAKGTVTEVYAPVARKDESVSADTKIIGRARYKGKSGYLILWHGITKEGKRATKLAFRDGTKAFWANGDVTVEKMYDEPITFARLAKLAAEFRAEKAASAPAPLDDAQLAAKVAAIGSTVIGTQTHIFERIGKASVEIGEVTTWTRRDKSRAHGIVISVGGSHYASRDDLDDMDEFDRQAGWSTPYTVREITEPAKYREAREKRENEAARAKQAEAAATADREAKIAAATAGLVRIDGTYGRRAGAEIVVTWSTGRSDRTTYMRTVAEIDGTPCVLHDWSGYDDGRSHTWVTPATRDLIFAARMESEMARKGITREAEIEYCREYAVRYGGCYGGGYSQWVVEYSEVAA